MPKLYKEFVLKYSRDKVFNEMKKLDFEKKLVSNVNIETLFENSRLVRWKWENVTDSPGFEKIIIPENYTIISQRKPMSPFIYNIFICIFYEIEDGTLIKFIQDTKFENENINKEKAMLSKMEDNTILIINGIKKYFEDLNN